MVLKTSVKEKICLLESVTARTFAPLENIATLISQSLTPRELTWSDAPDCLTAVRLKLRSLERAPIVNPFVLKKNNM